MAKNRKPISIIVPCYNVVQYFERCIDSLLSQTYKDIEIILVDDGSTDGTSKLIEKYQKIDTRIVVLEQQNAGLSAARNSGLKIAKGEYVCFVDSDDYVGEDYIRRMCEELEKTGSDICACNYSYIFEDGTTKPRISNSDFVCDAWTGLKDIFSGRQETGVVTWNKLFKIDLFRKNKIVFPVGKINEDNFTTYKLYYFAEKICYISEPLYYYLQRNDSIMGRKFDKRRMDILEAYKETEEFFKTHKIDNDINDYLECYRAMIYINLYNKIVRSKYVGAEKNIVRDDILAYRKKYLKNKILSRKIKMMLCVFHGIPTLYNLIIMKVGGK